MTTYTAFGVNGNGATGPSTSLDLFASWTAGLLFEVTESGYQLAGYGQWITNDGSMTSDLTFALWEATGEGTGTLVSGSEATISTLTPGTFQYVTLATPIALTENQVYKAVVCSGSAGCLPWQNNMFGGDETYADGVTNGPLNVFGNGGSNQDTYGDPQATYAEDQSNPTTTYPTSNYEASNPWLDVQITPAGTTLTATASLTVTPSFSAVPAHGHYQTASLTVTPSFTAARTRGRYRTAALTVTPSFTAARLHVHGRTAGLEVTPSFTAARIAAHLRQTGLTITPSFQVLWSGGAAPAKQTGSWWGLDSILKESRQEFDAYRSRPPMACPVCGEPLVNAPATPSASGIELYCKYAGDHRFHYPGDWHPPSRPWY